MMNIFPRFTCSAVFGLLLPALLLTAMMPAWAAAEAKARVIHVSAQGDDAADGESSATALRHIQAGLDAAGAGDTVRVHPGVYVERLETRRPGEPGRPIVLEGVDGAIVDGRKPTTLAWKRADDLGEGVYETPFDFNPMMVTVDGKMLVLLNPSRVQPSAKTEPEWVWTHIFKHGIRDRWDGVRGLALYLEQEQRLIIRLDQGAPPDAAQITVAPAGPAVQLSHDDVVVKNLEIRNSEIGIKVDNAERVEIADCLIGPTAEGIWLGEGTADGKVHHNEITQNPYSVYEAGSLAWDTWLAHKSGGYWDTRAIYIYRTQGGHEVHDNYIHHHWDGISDVHWLQWNSTAEQRMGWAHFNQDLNIHHNRLNLMNDDALEANGAEVNNRWHHNLISNARCAFRVKAVDVGPMYIYRNLFVDNNEDIRFFGSLELNPAEVYVYHNTSTSDAAITSNKIHGIGTPNFHVYNNLFYPKKWWHNSGESVDPNWSGDHNAYLFRSDVTREAIDEMKQKAVDYGLDGSSVWSYAATSTVSKISAGDLTLSEMSPAREAGVVLSDVIERQLPDEPGYASGGRRPDAGAIPFGAAMPQIPRPAANQFPDVEDR